MEKIYPDDKNMLFEIGDNLFHLGRYDAALNYFDRVYAIDPDHQPLLQHLFWLHQLKRNHEKMFDYAKQYFLKALSSRAWYSLVEASGYGNRYEEGLKLFAQYRQLHPKNVRLAIAMQYLHLLRDDYQRAGVEISKIEHDFGLEFPTVFSIELALYQGKYTTAYDLTQRRLKYRYSKKDTLDAMVEHVRCAMILAWRDLERARIEFKKADRFIDRFRFFSSLTLILIGNHQEAHNLINEFPISQSISLKKPRVSIQMLSSAPYFIHGFLTCLGKSLNKRERKT